MMESLCKKQKLANWFIPCAFALLLVAGEIISQGVPEESKQN